MADVKVIDNSKEVKAQMKVAVFQALSMMGVAGEAHAKENMNKPMPHADGETRPYIDTGRLRNDISNIVQGNSAYIGTNVEYGIYIHEGTRYIQPNRFLRDAVAEHADEYKQIAEQYLKGTVL